MIKGISGALFSIFGEGKYADKVVPTLLRSNPSWGSRDRRFIAENVYEIVRYWRLYWHQLGETPIIDEGGLLRLVSFKLKQDGYQLPESLETDFPEHATKPIDLPAGIKESYPEWIHELASKQLGDRWPIEANALNQPAPVFLRVNLSRISREQAMSEFQNTNIPAEIHPELPGCLVLTERRVLDKHPLLTGGFVEIQDAGSQLIASYLDPKPGSLILDACAGAGGKTMHLADLTNNKAKIISADVEHWKLKNLLFRAQKSNFNSISIITLPSPDFFQKNHQKIDSLLLDVPCSGLGVIKRNPDTKWKLTPEHLAYLKETQQQILSEYSLLVRPGGKLVYATCSILPEENQLQVERFLNSRPEAKLIRQHHQWPSMGTDGFYMALIQL